MPQPHNNPNPARLRRRGLLEALGGLVSIYLLWPLGLMKLLVKLLDKSSGVSSEAGGLLAGLLAAPFVLFCVGVLEMTTGRPFRRLSSAWNQLNEWKQGMLSFLLLGVGIGMVGLILYITARYYPDMWIFE